MGLYQLPKQYHPDFINPRVNPSLNVKVVTGGIGRNLEAAMLPMGNNWIDLKSGQMGIPINTPTNSVGRSGRQVDYTSGNSEYTQFTTQFISPFEDICNGDVSIAIVFQTVGTSGFWAGFGSDDNSTEIIYFQQSGSVAGTLTRSANSVAAQFSAGPTINDGLPHLILLQKSGNAVDLYVDGNFAGTDTSSGFSNWNMINQFAIGGLWRTSVSNFFTGGVFGCSIWSRMLTAPEIKSLSLNFWQIYEPQTPVTYFTSNGGVPPSSSIPVIMNHLRNQGIS